MGIEEKESIVTMMRRWYIISGRELKVLVGIIKLWLIILYSTNNTIMITNCVLSFGETVCLLVELSEINIYFGSLKYWIQPNHMINLVLRVDINTEPKNNTLTDTHFLVLNNTLSTFAFLW